MKPARFVPAALLLAGSAAAQAPGPSQDTGAPAGPQAAPAGGQAAPAGGSAGPTVTTTYMPWGVPNPGTDLYPGLGSSSRPINGDTADGFDLGKPSGGGGVVFGNKGADGVIGSERASGAPDYHVVKKGDTLWDLCSGYFQNPWEWPTVWSYNPQIQNPHWIYPGDELRLRHPNQISSSRPESQKLGSGKGGTVLNRNPRVAPNTVFLRDQGFLGDPKRDVWGELVGAVEEQMLLAYGNQVYLMMREGVELQVGQELTVFREVRQPESVPGARKPPGEVVAVNGTVKINRWDPKTRVARATVTESVDIIERGAKVGPVGRRFDVVQPKKNTKQVEARILNSFYPLIYIGQNQVTFIDRGSDDGLAPGNTLLVLRRGDTWRSSLSSNSKMIRDRVRMDSPERVDVESTPLRGDPQDYPDEAVAELRVLRVEKYSSIALVIQSRREVVPGDRAVAVEGR